jgi:hypothetical protein
MKTTPFSVRHLVCLTTLFFLFSATAKSQNFSIICPADVTVSCEDDLSDLTIYGGAVVMIGKGTAPLPDTDDVTYNTNSCNVGTILRKWTTTYKKQTFTCTQVITVLGVGGDISDIDWPDDITLTDCDPATAPSDLPTENSFPTFSSPPCSMVGVNYDDQRFMIGPQCEKIVRTWSIIDWCRYDGSGSGPGFFTFKQNIKLDFGEEPVFSCPDDVIAQAHNCYSGEVINPPLVIPNSSCNLPYEITNNSQYATSNGADLSGVYPIGTTTVQYRIEYGCGSVVFCYVDVIVEDVSVPVPYCIATIHSTLWPVDTDDDGVIDNGMIEVKASKFDHNSHDLCGNSFTVSFAPDEIVPTKVFTCDDVGENRINIYYISENGNYSFCTVTLDIQNNDDIPNCEPTDDDNNPYTRIAGEVRNIFGEEEEEMVIECQSSFTETEIIENVDSTTTVVLVDSFINAAGNWIWQYQEFVEYQYSYDTIVINHEQMHHSVTDELGTYSFDSVTMNIDYELRGICPEVDMSLIDECDLNLLVDHILGEQIITDPAILFAADLDENGQVDFDDLKHLMFYLGGINDELPYQNAYYLVPTSVENNFYDSPLTITYSDLDTSKIHTDFTYIQKGNLCSQPFSSHQKEKPMNIFASITKRLPAALRSSVEADVPRDYTEPAEFAFYPNPFSQSFVISINNPKAQVVEIEVFDNQGKRVYRRSAFMDKGFHSLDNDMESATSGIYFYQVTAGDSEFHGRAIKN